VGFVEADEERSTLRGSPTMGEHDVVALVVEPNDVVSRQVVVTFDVGSKPTRECPA